MPAVDGLEAALEGGFQWEVFEVLRGWAVSQSRNPGFRPERRARHAELAAALAAVRGYY
jgi:hypothetical protein